MPQYRRLLLPALILLSARCAHAQVYHADLAGGAGTEGPPGWTLGAGAGKWEAEGHGGPSLSVTGTGDDLAYWKADAPHLKPETLYRLRYWAKIAPGSASGTVISGLDSCNRDFDATEEWQPYSFVFTAPTDVAQSFLRFGQWHLKGMVFISDITLAPVLPLYKHMGDMVLGEGERTDGTAYSFVAPLDGAGGNSAHTLVSHTAPFNSSRWVFTGEREVVYRHTIPGTKQLSGQVRLDVGFYISGECIMSASRDGRNWTDVTRIHSQGAETIALPPTLFPAETIYVRLRGTPANPDAGVTDPGAYQIEGYGYNAVLDHAVPLSEGSTHFLEVQKEDLTLHVAVDDLGEPGVHPSDAAHLMLPPAAAGTVAELTITQAGKPPIAAAAVVPPAAGPLLLPYRCPWTGAIHMTLTVGPQGGPALFAASTDDYVPLLFDASYGYAVANTPEGALWCCESDYKVSRGRAAPTAASTVRGGTPPAPGGPRLMMARRERQAFQLVLRAGAEPTGLKVTTTSLSSPGVPPIPASAIDIRQVGYVRVRAASDAVGAAADWPDPLIPLDGDWTPKAGVNNPLWVTVTIPAGAKPGEYSGSIVIAGKRITRVPLHVHVWSFALPEKSDLRSGFGINAGNIRQYHNLTTDAQFAAVWDLYMRDFAAHRLAPYNAMQLAPIHFDVTKSDQPTVKLDFTDFDRSAHHYLDDIGFNAFTVPFPGLGHGRYPDYDPGDFAGYTADSTQYDALMTQYGAQLTEHLEKNGWLAKAYVYWYDEPQIADYPFVVTGMGRVKKYAPKIKRMLTEQVEEPLVGSVDLWCPITPTYKPAVEQARQKAGDEVWWYVCTIPKEPYPGLFIDHPAIEMRMWLWQTWKYSLQGILIWETAWWTSPRQSAVGAVQNPWTDTMSYPAIEAGVWGNGDGRLFYPPNRDPANDHTPHISGPVDSMRWELLAAGVQDWEYFHLLDKLVMAREAAGDRSVAVQRARLLLTVPDAICADTTHFTDDPNALNLYRLRLAHAIDGLSMPKAANR